MLEFKELEVINLYNGKILGNVSDLIINMKEGKIEAIIVPESNKIRTIFNTKNEYVILWNEIKKIGEEVILVVHDYESCLQE
ncbi:PRC-barrel domain-containing protein [Garciella nitratireducens]|uniref:Sporulation protein, YlmC/YmxH family n=1 Tax=Garciella nitratireducens DSM 15102 TaxID=1121911 RepID=A0A1T4JTT9_9FIRM|nr:YlmC/YmxH family sporulation protein [Garciella nitratireducens]RBP45565.1 YlmC/YmxH family sporulation protein [Garciella nitratireducens]SJZ33569.1 sporulation protein, YlmC/YmxH family [Garciella nitratireducens DSM 15102]